MTLFGPGVKAAINAKSVNEIIAAKSMIAALPKKKNRGCYSPSVTDLMVSPVASIISLPLLRRTLPVSAVSVNN